MDVPPSADPETLRRSFRRLSKALHPDTTTLPAEQAARQFQQLRESYELLSDPERRRRYDAQLSSDADRQRPSPPQPTLDPAPSGGWQGIGERRPLSGGEWFSLLLLLLALLLCLVLGLGVASMQGRSWQVSPEWMTVDQTQGSTTAPPPDVSPSDGTDPLESTFSASPGTLVAGFRG